MRDTLVDHQRTDFNLLRFQLALADQGVLLVEECDERRTIVSSVALRRENEPVRSSMRNV